jgi:hypothetical protein
MQSMPQGAMGGMPIMGMMGMMMAMMEMSGHIEGRIAFLKTELKITETQMPQWNAFVEALRGNAGRMSGACKHDANDAGRLSCERTR